MSKEIERAERKLKRAKEEVEQIKFRESWKGWFKAKTWFFIGIILLLFAFVGGFLGGILDVDIVSEEVMKFLWVITLVMFFVSLILGESIIKAIENYRIKNTKK